MPFREPGIPASGADGWMSARIARLATVIARLATVVGLLTALALAAASAAEARPTCFGKRATIVGNKHGNHISGTAHRDVIVAPACPGPMRFAP
jgi:hypothetical protein